jgi:sporulation protein YlmC with PRC-barrel domain
MAYCADRQLKSRTRPPKPVFGAGGTGAKGHALVTIPSVKPEEKQMTTRIIVALLAATTLTGSALAQSTAPSSTQTAPAATDVTPKSQSGQWRSSKLIGLNVYNDQNEKLGDINEIILDRSGKVTGYVVGVGGFLGVGEHDVLVEPTKLKFVDEPARAATNTTGNPPAGAPSNTRNVSNTSNTGTSATGKRWYPDHAMLSANKDQLKSMPQFKYD